LSVRNLNSVVPLREILVEKLGELVEQFPVMEPAPHVEVGFQTRRQDPENRFTDPRGNS
jgi:hypothetical protein